VASIQLALQNVSINFGDSVVLKNVTLEVAKGESVVLIGPSGKGKTVMPQALRRVAQTYERKVLVEGMI